MNGCDICIAHLYLHAVISALDNVGTLRLGDTMLIIGLGPGCSCH